MIKVAERLSSERNSERGDVGEFLRQWRGSHLESITRILNEWKQQVDVRHPTLVGLIMFTGEREELTSYYE